MAAFRYNVGMETIVTFVLESTDPEDATGLTEDDYMRIMDGVAQLGGYDVDFAKKVS